MKNAGATPASAKGTMAPIEELYHTLKSHPELNSKLEMLKSWPQNAHFLATRPNLKDVIAQLNENAQYVLHVLIAIGQGAIVFQRDEATEKLPTLIQQLQSIEEAYSTIGGILGYHRTVLRLIQEKEAGIQYDVHQTTLLKPKGYEITQNHSHINQMIKWGIDSLPALGEMYPVGGAGDRLDLQDEKTKMALPAAGLHFNGFTLLETLVRDVQAKEYLYYKLTEQQVTIPIALMTSHEKDNHKHIKKICEEKKWFGRSEQSFFLFSQPMVPVLTAEGDWAVSEHMKLILKPGGHGVIWKLAKDSGAFTWFSAHQKKKILVRQINNPVAGLDYGLLAFTGIGFQEDKKFGFLSCPRLLHTAEGMDILVEKKNKEAFEYTLTNIEYTDFAARDIQDIPENPDSCFSKFPANTNILFVDIPGILEAVERNPLPGKLINMKTKMRCLDASGSMQEVYAGRLETLMQNIADEMTDLSHHQLSGEEWKNLKTFITFNERRKTISVTKKSYKHGQPIIETPEGCFYELLQNHYELLTKHCQVKLPHLESVEEYMKHGPTFLLYYHPALGPLYDIIGQKIVGGQFKKYAELQAEITELDIRDLDLEGSLLIHANHPLGNEQGKYTHASPRCELHQVKIINKGIERNAALHCYWKKQMCRREALTISLGKNAEFFAERVTFQGDYKINIPDHHRGYAYEHNGNISIKLEPIHQATWHWKYTYDQSGRIRLEKE